MIEHYYLSTRPLEINGRADQGTGDSFVHPSILLCIHTHIYFLLVHL